MNNWHSLEKEEVLDITKSNITGLTSKEAKKRIEKNGINALPKPKENTIFKVFINQFITNSYFFVYRRRKNRYFVYNSSYLNGCFNGYIPRMAS